MPTSPLGMQCLLVGAKIEEALREDRRNTRNAEAEMKGLYTERVAESEQGRGPDRGPVQLLRCGTKDYRPNYGGDPADRWTRTATRARKQRGKWQCRRAGNYNLWQTQEYGLRLVECYHYVVLPSGPARRKMAYRKTCKRVHS